MGAVPKNKISRHRRGNRRRHLALTAPHLVACGNCGDMMKLHHVCRTCGTYRGRQLVDIRTPKSKQDN